MATELNTSTKQHWGGEILSPLGWRIQQNKPWLQQPQISQDQSGDVLLFLITEPLLRKRKTPPTALKKKKKKRQIGSSN